VQLALPGAGIPVQAKFEPGRPVALSPGNPVALSPGKPVADSDTPRLGADSAVWVPPAGTVPAPAQPAIASPANSATARATGGANRI
jgi:hypothetical protein